MRTERKALLLSVGYGQGHHMAARALADELARRGWRTTTADACAEAHPALFRLTQEFYRFCVRHMPWVWGAVYGQIDAADWSRLICMPGIAGCMRWLRRHIKQDPPDLVICTYPLFAYMLDALAREGSLHAPYAVVVTDSLAICRPWIQNGAPLICLPDEYSAAIVQERYALPAERLATTGFPVRAGVVRWAGRGPLHPGSQGEGVHVIYSCHAPLPRVVADVQTMLAEWPRLRLTLLAENLAARLSSCLGPLPEQVRVCGEAQDMAALLPTAHIYIGKAGASTMFEAYSAEVPMLVNYALPGQEEGNLQLLLRDGAGKYADTPEALLHCLRLLLADSGAGWAAMLRAMVAAHRSGGAARTIDECERRFFT